MAAMGLPLLVRTARAGFEQVDPRYEDVAATLGASPARIFFTISLPLAAPSVVAGAVLGVCPRARRVRRDDHGGRQHPGRRRGRSRWRSTPTPRPARTEARLVLLGISAAIACAALWIANRLSERRPA